MSAKKKLMLIVPTLGLGGQERVAVNTAEIMGNDYDIAFVVFDGSGAFYAPPCDVINLDIPAADHELNKVKNALRRAGALRRLKRGKRIDFTLSFGDAANLANVLSGQRGRTFLTIHGYSSATHNIVGAYLYRHCQKVACVSKVIASELSRLYRLPAGKALALYNPYDFSMMREKAQEPVTDYTFSPHTIVTHGRLDAVKNYPRLIKAFSLVRAQIADAQLLIVGEGSLRPQLEALVKAYHLEDSVSLIGLRKNPFAYLAKSALYVLSSYSEGFPNALVEGMTFLPAVAVDCKTGPREILSNGPIDRVCAGYEEEEYGVLVQPARERRLSEELTKDDRILADAILPVLTDPVKMKDLQEKAQSRVNVFSYEAYHEALLHLLEG